MNQNNCARLLGDSTVDFALASFGSAFVGAAKIDKTTDNIVSKM